MRAILQNGEPITIKFYHKQAGPGDEECQLEDGKFRYILGWVNRNPYYAETVCTIEDEKQYILGTGAAKVSLWDSFNKHTGRAMALKRALEAAKSNREERIFVFHQYQLWLKKGSK